MGFGERLKKAREAAGLTQEALGKGLGTKGKAAEKSVVYGWERRNHFPRVDQLALICGRLNVSADHLVLGVDPVWPFSAELQQVVKKLDRPARLKLENVMRAHLEMPPGSASSGFYSAVVSDSEEPNQDRKSS